MNGKMIMWAAAAIACAAAMAGSQPAGAAIITYQFGLDGLQEVPPNATPGWGWAVVTLDTDSGLLSWEIEYSNLIGQITAAHFHGAAPPGENAGVQVNIPIGPSPLVGNATINQAQMDDLMDGLWYVNIHTNIFPGGEIRGQVVPGAGGLALLGLAGLGVRRRRRE